MRPSVYIVDIIGSIVTATNAALTGNKRQAGYTPSSINYIYGDKDEIVGKIRVLQENNITDTASFPLIGLVMPFAENLGNSEGGFYGDVNFPEIVIAQRSTESDDFVLRYQKVMKPVVYPIYEQFLLQLALSGKFNTGLETRRIRHTKTDWPNFIPKEKKAGQAEALFNDYIDAIIITNLLLTINQAVC